jgi:hypothetical protein
MTFRDQFQAHLALEKTTILYNYIRDYPTHGPRRISNELKAQGTLISETGIYHVLRRRGLNKRLDRLFYTQEHSDNPVITERYLREKAKKEETYIGAFHPGDHIFQDTFYVGPLRAWVESISRPGLSPGVPRVMAW